MGGPDGHFELGVVRLHAADGPETVGCRENELDIVSGPYRPLNINCDCGVFHAWLVVFEAAPFRPAGVG